MSAWDAYIDNLHGHANGHCDQVAIIGLNGSVWTSTQGNPKGIAITPAEALKIATAISQDNMSEFQMNGVYVAGIKYQFLRKDENTYHCKKKEMGCLTMQMTKQTIVLAHTKEGSQVGETNKAIGTVCEYLETNNY